MEKEQNEITLKHLQRLKPYDGFSIDNYINSSGKSVVMLRRRNVPLSNTSTGYTFLTIDEKDTGCVVGVTSVIGQTNQSMFLTGDVLIEKDGSVTRDSKSIRLTIPLLQKSATSNSDKNDVQTAKDEREKNIQAAKRSSSTNTNVGIDDTTIMEDQSIELVKLCLMIIGAIVVLRLFANFVMIVITPLVILYAMQTIPPIESFEPKRELKRVLRGHHLPENHPDKPKDWLSTNLARLQATVTTELATGLGYQVEMNHIFGIFVVAIVTVPTMNSQYYWIGAFSKWRYLYQRQLPPPDNSTSAR